MNFQKEENLMIMEYQENSLIDFQGIDWSQRCREGYQRLRIKNFMTSTGLNVGINQCQQLSKGLKEKEIFLKSKFYKNIRVNMNHLQLPNNLVAVSEHDIYFIHINSIKHFSTKRKAYREIYKFYDHFTPVCINHFERYVFVGDIAGKVFVFDVLEQRKITEFYGTIDSNSSIINNIEITNDIYGIYLKCATNQKNITTHFFNLETEKVTFISEIKFSQPVNNISTHPNQNLIAAVIDSPEIFIVGKDKEICFKFNSGYSENFGCDFHHNGNLLATSGEDNSVRLWDLRKPAQEVKKIFSIMSPIYKVKFMKDCLIFPELLDFMHIYKEPYDKFQIFDFFGNTSGFDFFEKSIFLSNLCNDNEGIFTLNLM